MQQKVALTTAFFPPSGTLADMGCGSGAGSFDLACLFSGLQVIGVDIAEQAVAHAQAHYQRPNLSYRLGDIADPLFAPESLDGVLNSSVWHHLTSFNGFKLDAVERALANQTTALRPGGVLIVRDFVVPRFPPLLWLDVPTNDGLAAGFTETLSTAAAFELFCNWFRSSQNLDFPVPYRRLCEPRPGFARYEVAGRAAAEFLLHKDYRADFPAECKEEYTFYTQAEYEAAFARRDLRIVLSVELYNPWIAENRFLGRAALFRTDGQPLPFPPTNYLIVGEKVRPRHGVRLRVRTRPLTEPSFLQLHTLLHKKTGQLFQLAQRPNPVIDLIPWFRHEGRVFVLAKQGFPRPLGTTLLDSPALDGAKVAGYLTETLTAQTADLSAEALEQAVPDLLFGRAGLPKSALAYVRPGLAYYTSPGGLSEHVQSFFCELDADNLAKDGHGFPVFPDSAPNYTPFVAAGRVQPFSATQLLRAAQVGGLQDARLELNIYELLFSLSEPLGPFIGVELSPNSHDLGSFVPAAVPTVLASQQQTVFEPVPTTGPGFLDLHHAHVEELDCDEQVLCTAHFELCAPRVHSLNTVSVLPLVLFQNQAFVGLERRDLPAVDLHTHGATSSLVTCPAWRLPRSCSTLPEAQDFLSRGLLAQFGVHSARIHPLGGKYYPSVGATPEVVYPFVAEVNPTGLSQSMLAFVALTELLAHRHTLSDGHLLIALFRLSHALCANT